MHPDEPALEPTLGGGLLPGLLLGVILGPFAQPAFAQEPGTPPATARPDFDALREEGAQRSGGRTQQAGAVDGAELAPFESIQPILVAACLRCHGPERRRGGLRIDALDPDLIHGSDVEAWTDVLGVLSNREMPPEGEGELADEERGQVVEWLTSQLQVASRLRRATSEHSSFRRMTRYEYEYALQDLLGMPFRFAEDLPPDPTSEDGFQANSEVLHLSPMQLRAYLDSNRAALREVTALGPRPAPLFWAIPMEDAAAVEWERQDEELERLRQEHGDPATLDEALVRRAAQFRNRPQGAHFVDHGTGRKARQSWQYGEARYAWAPSEEQAAPPVDSDQVAVLPAGSGLIVELGDRVPDEGVMRVRVRASRAHAGEGGLPSLQLVFGWQASNDSHGSVRVSDHDLLIEAPPDAPRDYQWDVHLSQVYPRNSVRGVNELGDLPSPSEYVKVVNASVSASDVHLHHVEIIAPVHEQWPPASHARIFVEAAQPEDEEAYARKVLQRFMPRAWRRGVSAEEVQHKLDLFARVRPSWDSAEEALIEVLAVVLSSPNFLYLVVEEPGAGPSDLELATGLAIFLWCSTPDEELLALAREGRLKSPEVLAGQVERLLSDPRSRRFSRHFVSQWLGLAQLDHLHVDGEAFPHFDATLKESMGEEPIEFFHEILQRDHSALEFLHSDFTMANERLAQHYGLRGVTGNHFRRVELEGRLMRGGLLPQAGLLAMNSDGQDSHPLKRGVWLLERLLNDPPPPPPPAVPEIDLADPEVARMTLKQRLEDHRNDPACMSCHARIDPWGIAFENFDAVGSWRTEVQGQPVDARSTLFNQQTLDGMDGLKSFLLVYRQDQFVRALIHKLTTYALGRPLAFGDRAAVDEIAAEARERGGGLATMIKQIATSELFRSR